MVLQDQSLLKQVIDGVNVGVGQVKALDMAWVVAELAILGFEAITTKHTNKIN